MILDKRADLGHGDVKKLLFSLSVPTITSQIVNMLYNLVDRVFIGHMQPAETVGKLALTGVGVCLPIIMVISAFAALISSGGAPRARLDRVAATLVKAEALVGVDTGLSHLAAALGLPTVGLYVSTPTEILHLVGDGPVRSLGNVGEIPTWREAKTALDAVRQEQKENGCS